MRPGVPALLPALAFLIGFAIPPGIGAGADRGAPARDASRDPAIARLLAAYTGLYAADTLDRWSRLLHPALSVAYSDASGAVRVLDRDQFLRRQRDHFASGRRISERLENVRVETGRRIARVTADFVFVSDGEERRGALGLHLVKDGDDWTIVAILFSYDGP